MEFISPGLNKLQFDLGKAPAALVAGAVLIVKKTAYDMEADAKVLVAVDTGFLQNSISTHAIGLYAEIGPTASYGEFVEDGTSTQAPQPYMKPAYDRNVEPATQAFAQLVGGLL